MKAKDITIEVNAKLKVDRKTAEGCLKMVEMYVNDSGENILVDREENGELSFRLDKSWPRDTMEGR